MKKTFLGASLITFSLLWLASGPNWESFTKTGFAFFLGLMAGIWWGFFFLMWIVNGLKAPEKDESSNAS